MAGDVRLVEITAETVRDVCRLELAPGQERFVAPNAVSIAQAHFHPTAWFRAIHAGRELAGFVMLDLEPGEAFAVLWRLMIAAPFQGRGIGASAMGLIVDHVRSIPGKRRLLTSYVPGPGCPEPFYRGLGFVPTGEVDEGEVVLALDLGSAMR